MHHFISILQDPLDVGLISPILEMVKLWLRNLNYFSKPMQPVRGRAGVCTQACMPHSPIHHIKLIWTQSVSDLYWFSQALAPTRRQ